MKKRFSILLACMLFCSTFLTGCFENNASTISKLTHNFNTGMKVEVGDEEFYVYGSNEGTGIIDLLAANNYADDIAYDDTGRIMYEYRSKMDDLGIKWKTIDFIDYQDLDKLCGKNHSNTITGLPYSLLENGPSYLNLTEGFWLSGYSKYDSYTWANQKGEINDVKKEEGVYGVRPAMHIMVTDLMDYLGMEYELPDNNN